MHGAGNSFVLLENMHGELQGMDLSRLALHFCRERDHADGLIVIIPASEGADFGMLFYNADGSLGEMCGNGARCAARYGAEHGLAEDTENIRIHATAGLVRGRKITGELYEIRLNDPSVIKLSYIADAGGERVPCSYVELGNPGIPHAVVEVSPEAFQDPDTLREKGRRLRHSASFPKGANVTFAAVTGAHSVRAVTFERGVEDFTLACGTGCGALTVSLLLSGRMSGDTVRISMPGGELSVRISREASSVRDIFLTGPTAVVGESDDEG